MIPGKIVRFVEQQANTALAGTRDRNLVPSGHRVSGWQFDAEGRTLTAFIPDPFASRLLEALRDNGQLALTLEEFPTHETYQFKGTYLSHHAIRPEEIEIANRTRERFVKSIRALYPDEAHANLLRASIREPTLAVTIEVHEVFLQTPGPGAGARIFPAAEA